MNYIHHKNLNSNSNVIMFMQFCGTKVAMVLLTITD